MINNDYLMSLGIKIEKLIKTIQILKIDRKEEKEVLTNIERILLLQTHIRLLELKNSWKGSDFDFHFDTKEINKSLSLINKNITERNER